MMYEVIKWKRTGMSRFEKVVLTMTEETLRQSFPTWTGDFVHYVGKDIYHITKLEERNE